MHIKIGPYLNFFGVYQLVDLLKYVGVHEPRRDAISEWLGETKLNDFLQWIYTKRKRTMKIKIHKYDTWNMEATLAHIILPMLKQLNATKHGAPFIDDEDVPEHLRSTAAPAKENEWDVDANHFARWDWIMHEMIWAFEQIVYDGEKDFYSGDHDVFFTADEMIKGPKDTFKIDHEGLKAWQARKSNAFKLFGKYFEGLWD